jgi:hypothetical protein
MNIQTFGKFRDDIPVSQEYLTLNFSPADTPLRQQRWKNYGLSADFLGDYFAAFFPGHEVPDNLINLKDTVKASVSFIANELLENAVKYSDGSINSPIGITLYLYEREIIFQVMNCAESTVAIEYQDFVRDIQSANLEELYIQQLEKTAMGEGTSRMGLLTILHDYPTTGGWKFETLPDGSSTCRITVAIHLIL